MFNGIPGNPAVPQPPPVGAYPLIAPSRIYSGLSRASVSGAFNYEGFLADGDYITLPSTFNGDIDYFNNAGVSQSGWPIAITGVSAAHTTWLGFCMDKADGLLYVATRGATLTNFILSSINSAGTIVNIATVTVTQPDAGTEWAWGRTGAGVGDTGACNFHRAADGSGDFHMHITSGTTADFSEEIVFSVAGSLVNDTAASVMLYNNVAGLTPAVHYRTPNGTYVGYFGPSDTAGTPFSGVSVGVGTILGSNSKYAVLDVPPETGIFRQGGSATLPGGYPTLWRGRIALASYKSLPQGPKYFDKAEFDRWADRLAVVGGVV